MIKAGEIVVFSSEEGTTIRHEIRGMKALLLQDFCPGCSTKVKILEGAFKDRVLYGEHDEGEISRFIFNKGKGN